MSPLHEAHPHGAASTEGNLSLSTADRAADSVVVRWARELFSRYPYARDPSLEWGLLARMRHPIGPTSHSDITVPQPSLPEPSPTLIDPLLIRSGVGWYWDLSDGQKPLELWEAIRTISETAAVPDGTAQAHREDRRLSEAFQTVEKCAEVMDQPWQCGYEANVLRSAIRCAKYSLYGASKEEAGLSEDDQRLLASCARDVENYNAFKLIKAGEIASGLSVLASATFALAHQTGLEVVPDLLKVSTLAVSAAAGCCLIDRFGLGESFVNGMVNAARDGSRNLFDTITGRTSSALPIPHDGHAANTSDSPGDTEVSDVEDQ